MNQFFVLVALIIGPILLQAASPQSDAAQESIGPQPSGFKISTDKLVYHYAYYQGGHEKIRIFAKIPQIIAGEKIEIKSVYSRGPHTFTDSYPICSDPIPTNCFAKYNEDIYFIDSERDYGTLFGKWALDATYGGQRASTVFQITTLNKFELDAARQKYTLKDLKDAGLQIAFLGSEVSNETTLRLEIFKIKDHDQKLILSRDVNVTISSQPPFFNVLPITFPNKVPFDAGKYNITGRWGNLFDSDTFEIVEITSVTTPPKQELNKPAENNGGGCLIATAAFGSELAPQVQILREFREGQILATNSGASFLQVFNSFYYSFSPIVADAERENPVLQVITKGAIYPLLGILEVSRQAMFLEGEIGTLSSGFTASILIGSVYLLPISLRLDFSKFVRRIILAAVTCVTVIAIGIALGNTIVLMVSTSVFVISSVALGATLTSIAFLRVRAKNKRRSN